MEKQDRGERELERMKALELKSVRRVHLVGVAGSGLSGMARLLCSMGMDVTGSEPRESSTLQRLRDSGIRCMVGHSGENLPEDADLVAISAAIGSDNPEVVSARKRGIPVLKYAQLLGKLMLGKSSIAVAGTHGKTTTTAMAASVLAEAGRDPGFLMGGEYPGLGGGSRWGKGEFFVVEACEFDRSFLNFHPSLAIVTNIEEEHLDYFHSLQDIQEAFGQFVGRLPADGCLVVNSDDDHSSHLHRYSRAPVVGFSLRPGAAHWWAEEIHPEGGGIQFRIRSAAGETARVTLRIPGIHNVKNALAVAAVLRQTGLTLEEIAGGLEKFSGVSRRFEILRREPVVVVDDYAHHPTEIAAVLRAARDTFEGRRIRLIFQPHQYSRTWRFLGQFARILADSDEAIVAEVFRARDPAEEVRRVNSAALVDRIQGLDGRAVLAPTFPDILEYLRGTLVEGDVLICLGAGDITQLARRIARELWEPEKAEECVA